MTPQERIGQLAGAVLRPGADLEVDGTYGAPGVVLVPPLASGRMAELVVAARERVASARVPVAPLPVALHEPLGIPELPPSLARAATWDLELVAELAAHSAATLHDLGVRGAPTPSTVPVRALLPFADLAGTAGSDPMLVADVLAAYVRGLQATGRVAALVRDLGGAVPAAGDVVADHGVGERTRRAALLVGAEAAVRAGALLVQPAGGVNDGIPVHSDRWLLQQLLRDEWGFDGVVVADTGGVAALAAVHRVADGADDALALAVESGVTVVVPGAGRGPDLRRSMGRLVAEGRLAAWLVDAAVANLLRVKLALGLLDDQPAPVPPDVTARYALAARAVVESTVLLTDPRGVLPMTGPGRAIEVEDGSSGSSPQSRALAAALRRQSAVVVEDGQAEADPETPVVVLVHELGEPVRRVARLVAAGRPCVALVHEVDPALLGPLVVTTATILVCWQAVAPHAGALAALLVGSAEPGGRLPVPVRDADGSVIFPVGHGQGYATFDYSRLRVEENHSAEMLMTVRCRVRNTGTRPGRAVVQVFVRDETATVARPEPVLVGFRSVPLLVGQSMSVAVPVPAARVAMWDRAMRRVVEPGTFTVLVGESPADIRLTGPFLLTTAVRLPDVPTAAPRS
jgi:beta-glucosidase-like glycosyl hydrolase